MIFQGKAVIIGFVGSVIGYIVGRLAGMAWRETPGMPPVEMALIDQQLMFLVLIAAPLLTALASWLPAIIAAQQDPADVLREE